MFDWLFGGKDTFEGKAIFITGCDTGFGRLMSQQFSEEGAHVYAGCLTQDGAQSLAAEAKGKITTVPVDVTKEASVKEAAEVVRKDLEKSGKRLYAVINNAGVASGWLMEFSPTSEYRKVMDVNFFGPVMVSKAFLPLMQQPGGRLVGVVSGAGLFAFEGASVYCCSKFAHNALMDSLRLELRPAGIKVIKIIPGAHGTPGMLAFKEAQEAKRRYDEATDDVRSRYSTNLVQENAERLEKMNGILGDPSAVVKTIRDSLLVKSPYPCYLIGLDAIIFGKVIPGLPIWVKDWIQGLR